VGKGATVTRTVHGNPNRNTLLYFWEQALGVLFCFWKFYFRFVCLFLIYYYYDLFVLFCFDFFSFFLGSRATILEL